MTNNEEIWEDRASRASTSFTKHPFGWIVAFIVAIFLLILIGNAFEVVTPFWEAAKAKITAKPRVETNIYQTENIIAKVEFFHKECESVKEKLLIYENNYARLVSAKEKAHLETDPLERQAAVQEIGPAQADVTAALNGAQASAAEYNAKASSPTTAPFRTIFSQHNLPERINLPAGEAAAAKFVVSFSCG